MVILPRCAAPSQILTDNMDQSKIPTIHSCCSRSKFDFHSFFAISRINWETPRAFIPWFGPLQSAIKSDLKHQISCPRSDFPSRGDDRAHSFRALVPVSEWEREEGVGPLLSALSPVLQSYNCYRRELQSHNGSPGPAPVPWQCDNFVKSQQLNTGSAQLDHSGRESGAWNGRDKHDGDFTLNNCRPRYNTRYSVILGHKLISIEPHEHLFVN